VVLNFWVENVLFNSHGIIYVRQGYGNMKVETSILLKIMLSSEIDPERPII
jgi:hypothetical protein